MVRYDKKTADAGRQYIDDRRGRRGRTGAVALGGGGTVAAIVALLFTVFTGGDLSTVDFGQTQAPQVEDQSIDPASDPDADTIEYMGFLMQDTQDTWRQIFGEAGLEYQDTNLVVFTNSVSTNGCGNATSAVGPFYCPAPQDQSVYIDVEFFDELATRFGAPGDFAQAYVVAHEVGHHIQAVTGTSDKIQDLKASNPDRANQYAVLQELQADCYAGIWAFSASQRTNLNGDPILESGDIKEGLQAAASVGDDKLQSQAGLAINAETWTHGSSEQRQRWFTVGFELGNPGDCDIEAIDQSEN